MPYRSGAVDLPKLNASMLNGWNWDLTHVAYGWGNYMYNSIGANKDKIGKRLGVAPAIQIDKDKKQITFTYSGDALEIANWRGTSVYITTWDIAGEGNYRALSPQGNAWEFGGGKENDPKVFDWIAFEIE